MQGLVNNVNKPGPIGSPSTIISQYNTDKSAETILYATVAGPLTYAVARRGFEFSLASSVFFGAMAGMAVYNQWPQLAAQNFGLYTAIWGNLPGRGRTAPSPFQK